MNRILALAFFSCLLFSLLIAQFFKVQVLEHKKWRKAALKQHYFVVKEPFMRGTFWANTSVKKGHPEIPQKLAVDIRKYHLYIDPHSLPKEGKVHIARTLMALCRPTVEEKRKFLLQFFKKSRSRKVASWLDEEKKKECLEWWLPYAKATGSPSNAVFFVPDHLRSHPFGKLLGQVLHTVQRQKEEKTHAAIPTGGLELSCNPYLKGEYGLRRLMRSPRRSLDIQQLIKTPKHGADCFLTVNHCLQAIAEEELEKGVRFYEAKGGWAVVMDPHTGHILALAQYPFFHPDHYSAYFSDPALMEHSKVKAITDAHEPGSPTKAITIAMALKANQELRLMGKKEIFHPLDKIDTSKGNFPGRGRKPLTDTHFHHYLNMNMALQKSSNIYCAILAKRMIESLGSEWYRKELHETFGFGKKCGIELPGESIGVLPMPGKRHPNGHPEWSLPTPYSLAIGYNLQATNLQMARAFAIFANGGYLVQPTLIKKIIAPDGQVLVDHTLPQSFPKVLDSAIVDEVVKGMKYVTKPYGTSSVAEVYGYTEAGKSGTSMKIIGGKYSNKHHFSSFVGFAPARNTALVVSIGIDEPKPGYIPGIGPVHHGGHSAAPIFREIMQRSLEYMGVPSDDPGGYPKGDPRHDPATCDYYQEYRKLRELYLEWNSKPNKGNQNEGQTADKRSSGNRREGIKRG
jgi:cell division protein FtsI (penicillin-binding protein 3)